MTCDRRSVTKPEVGIRLVDMDQENWRECVRGGLIRSAHSANFKTGLFGGGDASPYRAIDLDQCDWIAIPLCLQRKKAYSQRPRSVIVSEETKAESSFQNVNLIRCDAMSKTQGTSWPQQ